MLLFAAFVTALMVAGCGIDDGSAPLDEARLPTFVSFEQSKAHSLGAKGKTAKMKGAGASGEHIPPAVRLGLSPR